MDKATKIWLTAAAALILFGAILFAGAMTVMNWDFRKMSTDQYETNRHEITEDFHSISIYSDTADISFILSEDESCSVVCYESKNVTHSVSAADGTLVIRAVDQRKWYEHLSFHFGSPKINVYLPKQQYTSLFVEENTGDIEVPKDFQFENATLLLSTGNVSYFAAASENLSIEASTGSIRVENTCAGAMDLSVTTGSITVSQVTCPGVLSTYVSTGNTRLSHVSCKNLLSEGSTGDLFLKSVIAEEAFSITRTTGDVSLDSADAAEIFIRTGTGDVTGSLLSDKLFIAQSSTGSVNVPTTTTGGKCEIRTSTGSIKITVTGGQES